jgi:hypothetical protein
MFSKSYIFIGMFQVFMLAFVIQTYAALDTSPENDFQDKKTETNVYPNPVKTSIVTVETATPIKSIRVLNIVGEQVATFNDINSVKFEINVDDYKNGIYLLVTTLTSNETSVNKIIIE